MAWRSRRRTNRRRRRVGDAVIDARDGDVAGFQRLAQRIQHLAGEFRHLVEEQHAVTPAVSRMQLLNGMSSIQSP
jgi:hypothetical protein